MKILIIRFSSIGDIVLTSPVARCIKNQIPNASVHYLTKAMFGALVRQNPYVDEVHLLEESLSTSISELKSQNFDLIVDLHNNLRSTRIKRALGVQSTTVSKRNWDKWKMVNLKQMAPSSVDHIVERYLETLKEHGIADDGQGLELFISEADQIDKNDLPESHQVGYVALAIGASSFTKKLPVHSLIKLCQLIDQPIVLIGGSGDMEIGRRIQSEVGGLVHDCTGKYSILGSASLISGSKVVVCHDSGAMHIACALKKPTISIWGNTIPGFGFGPYQPENPENTFVHEVSGLSCRPCSKLGLGNCPQGHFKCMEGQNLPLIAEQCRPYLE